MEIEKRDKFGFTKRDNTIAILISLMAVLFIVILMMIFFGFMYHSTGQEQLCSPFCDNELGIG